MPDTITCYASAPVPQDTSPAAGAVAAPVLVDLAGVLTELETAATLSSVAAGNVVPALARLLIRLAIDEAGKES